VSVLPRIGARYRVHYFGDEGHDFITVNAAGDLGNGWDEVEFTWDEDGETEIMDADEFLDWPQIKQVSP
jgi:hypothetical protein